MKNTFEVLGSIQQNQTQASRISACKAQKTGVGLPPRALAIPGPLPPSSWQFSSFQSGLLVVRGRLTPCPARSWRSVNVYWLDGHVRTLSLEPSLYPSPAMRPPTLKKGPLCCSDGGGLCLPPFSTPSQPSPSSLPPFFCSPAHSGSLLYPSPKQGSERPKRKKTPQSLGPSGKWTCPLGQCMYKRRTFLKQPVSHYTGGNIEAPERRQCTPKAKLAGKTRVHKSRGGRDTVRLDLRLNKYVLSLTIDVPRFCLSSNNPLL